MSYFQSERKSLIDLKVRGLSGSSLFHHRGLVSGSAGFVVLEFIVLQVLLPAAAYETANSRYVARRTSPWRRDKRAYRFIGPSSMDLMPDC